MISISREYQKLRKSDFSVSMEEVKQPLSVFLYWCIPAILSVYFVKWLDGKGPANYLQTAIEQGVGPILWNTLACFGLILMSFSFAFPRNQLLSDAASTLLKNVYAIGCLSFGLLLGQFLTLIPEIHGQIEVWRVWILVPLSGYLLFVIFVLNFVVWYLSYLVGWGSRYNLKLRQLNWVVRSFVSFSFAGIVFLLLWIEQDSQLVP